MTNLSCSACRSVLALFLLFSFLPSKAQKEPLLWYFGDHNGLDFRSGSPVAISNPNVSSKGKELRGVSTVTDANGNLLFYAENETVYNRNHDTMQNGSKINSIWVAEQTLLTVRAIHDTTLYYLFTIDLYDTYNEFGEIYYSKPDLWYSIIDMKADNGLGAVTTKNVRLLDKTTTQLCAIRHCNGRDIWIVTHEPEADTYYSFLITEAGVSTTPVISHTGRTVVPWGSYGFSNEFGYLKDSPDGKKIAASWTTMGVDLSDFDNATGKVSNSIDLNLMNNDFDLCFGIEFSPSSGVLYADVTFFTTDYLYQYNVNAGSAAAIKASKTKVEEIEFNGNFAGMQRGPDNKIYVATEGLPSVAIINNPDVVGTGCNYVLHGLALNQPSSYSFPAYMESNYFPEPFTFTFDCPPEKVNFDYDKPDNVISVEWDFDDPASGSANTSTALSPVHEFTASGTYHVKLIRFLACNADTLEKEVSVTKLSVDLGNDTTFCANTGYLLQPITAGSLDYLWQDGSSGQTLMAQSSGLYWLQVTDPVSGCSERDSITLTSNAMAVELGPDTSICENETLVVDAGNQSFDYTWQDGTTNSSITVNTPGMYSVVVRNGTCTVTDTIEVRLNKKPVFDLGKDKEICGDEVVILGNHLQNNYSYSWEDGSSSPMRNVNKPGTFKLTATNECGSASDDIVIRKGGCALGVPNAFSPNADGRNDVFALSKTVPLQAFTMQVYNRWGQKIFESRDQSKGWDGTFGGKRSDVGHYAYVIQYRTETGAPVTIKGTVLLLRE